jgi:hypothetical protein
MCGEHRNGEYTLNRTPREVRKLELQTIAAHWRGHKSDNIEMVGNRPDGFNIHCDIDGIAVLIKDIAESGFEFRDKIMIRAGITDRLRFKRISGRSYRGAFGASED